MHSSTQQQRGIKRATLAALLVGGLGLSADSYRAWQAHQQQHSELIELADINQLPDHHRSIRVKGYVSSAWLLDEYGVAKGERPDQNTTPRAQLIPLLEKPESSDQPPRLEGNFIVVRRALSPEEQSKKSINTSNNQLLEFQGRLRPLDPAILQNLIEQRISAADNDPSQTKALAKVWMLDTLDQGTPADINFKVVAALACFGAALFLGLRRREAEAQKQ